MKKAVLFILIFSLQNIIFAQEISKIKITKLRRVINPLFQEKDKFNPILKNETVEQFYFDEELEKIKKEKLRYKLDNSITKKKHTSTKGNKSN